MRPVHVSISKPLTPITDVLASLAKQTGQTILTDDTAVAPVGIADLQAPTLDDMLDSLKSLDAGLTWHKVYLPKDAPLPTGNDLSAQVRALQAIAAIGLSSSRTPAEPSPSPARRPTPRPPPADMRLVYLVTDEAVRAQRTAAKAAEAAAKTLRRPERPSPGRHRHARRRQHLQPDDPGPAASGPAPDVRPVPAHDAEH